MRKPCQQYLGGRVSLANHLQRQTSPMSPSHLVETKAKLDGNRKLVRESRLNVMKSTVQIWETPQSLMIFKCTNQNVTEHFVFSSVCMPRTVVVKHP